MRQIESSYAPAKQKVSFSTKIHALLAQSVEHLTFNQVVAGSNPAERTTPIF